MQYLMTAICTSKPASRVAIDSKPWSNLQEICRKTQTTPCCLSCSSHLSQVQILWMRTISNNVEFWILLLAQIRPPVSISDITVFGFRFHCKTASHLADSISETATFYAETRWESTHLRQRNKPKSKRKRIENYRVRCLRSTMKTREDSMKGFRSLIYFNEKVLLVTGHQKI
jgi:hypothetical protein